MIHFRHKPIDKNESKYKRLSRIYYNRMFPKRQDALKVAWSVAAGVFIGIWPTIGIAIILTVAFCAVFRLLPVPVPPATVQNRTRTTPVTKNTTVSLPSCSPAPS